jgi:hypothetical protein
MRFLQIRTRGLYPNIVYGLSRSSSYRGRGDVDVNAPSPGVLSKRGPGRPCPKLLTLRTVWFSNLRFDIRNTKDGGAADVKGARWNAMAGVYAAPPNRIEAKYSVQYSESKTAEPPSSPSLRSLCWACRDNYGFRAF